MKDRLITPEVQDNLNLFADFKEVSKRLAMTTGAQRLVVFDDVIHAVPKEQRENLHALPGYERALVPALVSGMEFKETLVIVSAPPNPVEFYIVQNLKKQLEEQLKKPINFSILFEDPTSGKLINLSELTSPQQYLSVCLTYADWLQEPANRKLVSGEDYHLEILEKHREEILDSKDKTLVMPFQMTEQHKIFFDKLSPLIILHPDIPDIDKFRNNLLLQTSGFSHIPKMIAVTPSGRIITSLEDYEQIKKMGSSVASEDIYETWANGILKTISNLGEIGKTAYVKLDSEGVSGLGNLPPTKYPWLYDQTISSEEKRDRLTEVLSQFYPLGSPLPAITVVEEFVDAKIKGGVKCDYIVCGLLIDGKFYPLSISPFGVDATDVYYYSWVGRRPGDLGEDPALWQRLIEVFSQMAEVMKDHGYKNGVIAGDVLENQQGQFSVHDYNFRRGGRSFPEALTYITGKSYLEAQIELKLPDFGLFGLTNRQRFLLYTKLISDLYKEHNIIPFSTSFGYFGGDHPPEEPDFLKFKLAVPVTSLQGERNTHYEQIKALVTDKLKDLRNKIKKYEESGIILFLEDNIWPPYAAFEFSKSFKREADKIPEDARVVDIGVGSGILSILLRREKPGISVVATDLNEQAIKNAFFNWILNGGDPEKFFGVTGDGLSDEVVKEILERLGEVDVLLANLPQQPLIIKGEELENLRKSSAAAWNIDSSGDPDSLGIFMSVLINARKVMKKGGMAFVNVTSKQNKIRWSDFLNGLKEGGLIKNWEIASVKRYDLPPFYGPRLINYWLKAQENDGVPRLFKNGDSWQYDNYDLVIYY